MPREIASELSARTLAWGACLRAIPATKRATKACRANRRRAIGALKLISGLPTPRGLAKPEQAVEFLRRSCRMCAKCKGV